MGFSLPSSTISSMGETRGLYPGMEQQRANLNAVQTSWILLRLEAAGSLRWWVSNFWLGCFFVAWNQELQMGNAWKTSQTNKHVLQDPGFSKIWQVQQMHHSETTGSPSQSSALTKKHPKFIHKKKHQPGCHLGRRDRFWSLAEFRWGARILYQVGTFGAQRHCGERFGRMILVVIFGSEEMIY